MLADEWAKMDNITIVKSSMTKYNPNKVDSTSSTILSRDLPSLGDTPVKRPWAW